MPSTTAPSTASAPMRVENAASALAVSRAGSEISSRGPSARASTLWGELLWGEEVPGELSLRGFQPWGLTGVARGSTSVVAVTETSLRAVDTTGLPRRVLRQAEGIGQRICQIRTHLSSAACAGKSRNRGSLAPCFILFIERLHCAGFTEQCLLSLVHAGFIEPASECEATVRSSTGVVPCNSVPAVVPVSSLMSIVASPSLLSQLQDRGRSATPAWGCSAIRPLVAPPSIL
jgi:hypothetical protein